jgi:hypothetical protein
MVRWHARKPLRLGPYFRRYSATVRKDGARGGFTSHGFRFPLGPLGVLTWNLTHRRWTWDNPGPGSFTWGGRRR